MYVYVGKTGFGHEHAVVGAIKSGKLNLNLERDAGEIVFDMRSFTADTDHARKYLGLEGTTDPSTQKSVTANMRGEEVLDVNRYPTATFRVRRVTRLAGASKRKLPTFQLDGDFTLHGQTRAIRVVADAGEKDGWLHIRGGFSILQSQYGITPYSRALGAVGVTDALRISGDLWVVK